MSTTLIISILTGITSFIAFKNDDIMSKLKFNAYLIHHKKQWYRLLSHALVHADWAHLIINIMVFISFGNNVEQYFNHYFPENGNFLFLSLYVGGIVFSSLYNLIKQRNNHWYNAVGASGAVSAVLFASVFFSPMSKVYFFGIVPIPGIIFAISYLIYSYYMAKKSNDNIGHEAHFFGAIFGFVFPLILNPKLIYLFIDSLKF
jgi:membrane associated rhomboid family serine protease